MSIKANEILKFFEDKDYASDAFRKQMFEVDVKRHGMDGNCDIDKVMKNLHISPVYRGKLKEKFDTDTENGLYERFLESECRYVNEVFESRGSIICSKRKWWEKEVKTKIEKDEDTAYPYLNEIKTKSGKLEALEKWIVENEKELYAFSLITDEFGFDGRSGGHFVFDVELSSDISEIIEMMANGDWDNLKQFYPGEITKQTVFAEIQKVMDAIDYLKKFVDDHNKGIDFGSEIENWVDENIDDVQKEVLYRKTKSIVDKNNFLKQLVVDLMN